jgi:F0F1-type ATP synthase assembly protein I
MLIKHIKSILLSIKKKLPANGDWLYVTETADNEIASCDIADEYDSPEKVLKLFRSNDLDIIKLIYERTSAHEDAINDAGDQVREKAKTLLSTAGFISAILFGVAAFLLSEVATSQFWVFIVEVILFLFLSTHFVRSLSIAMQVMTREEFVRSSPTEFLSLQNGQALANAMKESISQIIAYSNQTQELIRRRLNKLILGQHAFRYGLIYFVALIFFHIVAVGFYGSIEKGDVWKTRFTIIENKLSELVTIQKQGINEIKKMDQEIATIERENKQKNKLTNKMRSAKPN